MIDNVCTGGVEENNNIRKINTKNDKYLEKKIVENLPFRFTFLKCKQNTKFIHEIPSKISLGEIVSQRKEKVKEAKYPELT